MGQEEVMKKVNANMDTPAYAYFSKQEDAKKVIAAIFIMEEMVLKGIQLRKMRQEIL